MLLFIGKYLSRSYIDNPIFVVGSGRSGTSVLLQALGAHPHILAFPGESPFLTSLGGNASLFIGSEKAYYEEAIHITYPSLKSKLARLGLEVSGGEYYAIKHNLVNRLTHLKFNGIAAKYWAAKTFPPKLVSTGLDEIYPGAKYLYIVRNGIDVVHSMTKFHGFKDNDFETHCKTWASSVNKYEYLQNKHNALMIRHEALTRDPSSVFTEIYNFLNLSNNGESAHFTKSNLIHPLDQSDMHLNDSNTQLLNRADPSAQWTAVQRKIFTDICSNQMQALGYDYKLEQLT